MIWTGVCAVQQPSEGDLAQHRVSRIDLDAALRWFRERLGADVPYTACATLFDGPPLTPGYERVVLELVEAVTSATGRVALRYRPRAT